MPCRYVAAGTLPESCRLDKKNEGRKVLKGPVCVCFFLFFFPERLESPVGLQIGRRRGMFVLLSTAGRKTGAHNNRPVIALFTAGADACPCLSVCLSVFARRGPVACSAFVDIVFIMQIGLRDEMRTG